MKIRYEKGFAIEKDADTIINSANGYLLLGTGGAGRIREASGRLDERGKNEYYGIMERLPGEVRDWYGLVFRKRGYQLSHAQLSCLKLLLKNDGRGYEIGSAVLDEDWSGKDDRKLIHAVAMSYRIRPGGHERINATVESVRRALGNAFRAAGSAGSERIACPVMCARKGSGVSPEASLKAIEDVLEGFGSSFGEAVICFDNESTRRYLDRVEGRQH